jgi:predicted RNA-binding Zn ribbon-like protein
LKLTEVSWPEKTISPVLPAMIGGHPALDFCNTFAGWHEEESTDFLRSYAHLALWTEEAGLLDTQSSRALRDLADGLERPMLATAWAAARFLTSADLSTVHACPGVGCGWLFLDPRGRRRWCRMEWCGNRAKVRAHAARQRTS